MRIGSVDFAAQRIESERRARNASLGNLRRGAGKIGGQLWQKGDGLRHKRTKNKVLGLKVKTVIEGRNKQSLVPCACWFRL